jgi:hypothetical protein
MTLVVLAVRKVAVIGWDTSNDMDNTDEHVITGANASLQVGGEELRTVKNDGESNLFFPGDFVGDVKVTVRGSRSGKDTQTLHIS